MKRLGSLFLLMMIVTSVAADTITTVAGPGQGADGTPASTAKLVVPFAVDLDDAGNLYFVELDGQRVRKIDRPGTLTTIAGTGEKGAFGDGGPAVKATFNGMHNLAVTTNGTIYLADTWNHKVRKIDPKTGIISTFAGTGKKGDSGDGGPALQAEFGGIYCITFDPKHERLYITDLDYRRIRVIDMKTGIVTAVAGNGKKGKPLDGVDAKQSPLLDPRAVAADSKGNVYILERGGNALRVVDLDGKIRTVVGTGKAGLSGDGGPGIMATMNGPKHLCVDDQDRVLIADAENHVIRRYAPKNGMITRIAGTGKKGITGLDGPPESCQLNRPHGVYAGADGLIYLADSYNQRILKITPSK